MRGLKFDRNCSSDFTGGGSCVGRERARDNDKAAIRHLDGQRDVPDRKATRWLPVERDVLPQPDEQVRWLGS